MNLEDRLRNHMHSAEDLFVEGHASASDISAAGKRRTRRNQIGAGLAAGVVGIGLVLGATSLVGTSDSDDIALDEMAQDEMAQDDAVMESAMIEPGASDSAMFDGPVASFDVIVGVDDGFVGLRNDAGSILAIDSDDGVNWQETPTTGLDDNIEIAALTHSDGMLAGVFRTFDKNTGTPQNFIGTATDGTNWTLIAVLADEPDAFVSGLAIRDGQVVTTASAFGASAEDEQGEFSPTGYIIRGPIGGPYQATVLDAVEFGVDRISATSSGFALSAFGDGAPEVWTSTNGDSWSAATVADPANQFSTIASADGKLLSIGSTNLSGAGIFQIFESVDGGSSWTPVGVPNTVANASWWSFDVRSSNEAVAVLLTGEAEQEVEGPVTARVGLVVSTGAEFREINLEPFVPASATAILIGVSADEVLLQVAETAELNYVRVPLR